MKAVTAMVAGALLAGSVAGRPHVLKRGVLTEVTFTTVTVANVIVYVDEQGVPWQTTTVDQITTIPTALVEGGAVSPSTAPAPSSVQTAQATSAASALVLAPSNVPAPPVQNVAPTPSALPIVTADSSPSSVAPTPAEPAVSSTAPAPPPPPPSPPANPPVSGDRLPLGVTYDPFKPGGCKTEQEVADEWAKMKDFGIVRIYGMGCDIIPRAVRLAVQYNQKLMAGIYAPSEQVQDVVDALAGAVKQHAGGNWDLISLVSVDNEKVNDKTMTASEAVDYIRQTKEALVNAGYKGPVGAVETAPAVIDNPQICKQSDFTLVNIHAFFDSNTKAEDAGDFVQREVQRVKDACDGKRVIVTESGWPHGGQTNGKAIPSKENQAAALASIRKRFDSDLFIHNAFDCTWKEETAGTFYAERNWGFL